MSMTREELLQIARDNEYCPDCGADMQEYSHYCKVCKSGVSVPVNVPDGFVELLKQFFGIMED